jgi:hypothetical protein
VETWVRCACAMVDMSTMSQSRSFSVRDNDRCSSSSFFEVVSNSYLVLCFKTYK